MKEKSIEELINSETEKRLTEMEAHDYEFPSKVNKVDYTIMAIAFVGSLLLIVLCMMGVIR